MKAYPVGMHLAEELAERGWTTRDCAERMLSSDLELSRLTLELLIAVPTAELDIETAWGLERAFGLPALVWMRIDEVYRDSLNL